MRLYLLFALALASDITAFRTLISKNGVNEVYRINSVTGKGDIEILITKTENGLQLQASNADTNVPFLSGTIGIGQNFLNKPCFYEETCQLSDQTTFTVKDAPNGLRFIFKTDNRSERLMDCYDFGDWNWYGGPERRVQTWPIENMVIDSSNAYVSRKDDNFGVAERYWLNSEGSYIFLNDENPLFVSQNEESTQGQFCFISDLEGPYFNRTSNTLEYVWSYRDDPKSAHLDAINTYLGKPTGHPNSKMISEPIWTTWAKYKRDIDDATVLEFAKSIRDQGYTNGQLEIDDAWEKCYGAQEFTEDKFSDITETVQQVKDMGFRVTLWVHPFVNEGCETNAQVGNDNDYFVRGLDGLNNATWWNGDKIGHQIDFTNPEAAEWWSSRLRKLQENPQIDSFKFDAGESDYGQQPSVYPNVDQNLIPNILTQSYIRTCAKFGDLIEVRSAWRTQDLPIFVRMLDKDTSWEMENGLPTLVTTLLQLNMNGYTMVLPDMIGGNGYSGELPSPELLVRWTQANTFMPAMQFSYLPWEITSTEFDVAAIVKKYVDIHAEYSDLIISAMEKSIQDGTPVNPPIWWKDPTDPIALACNDEYLVGEDILVAPVLENNSRSRSVYLPKGQWVDGHNGTVYEGPITLDYAADIDILPFFLST